MEDKRQMQMNEKNSQDKREVRRRRRVRNQVISYLVLILFILLMALGIVLGVRQLTAGRQENQEEEQEDSLERIDDLLGMEESLQTPEPTPEVVEQTPEQKLDEIVNAGIEVMPLEDKVAGLFIVTPEAITGVDTAVKAGEGTRDALFHYPVGGIIYFGKNMQSEEQLREMLGNTSLYAKYPLFLAVDEEGGSVSRVADAGIGPKVDSASAIGAAQDTNGAYQAGTVIGTKLYELGFNLDFAPVADVASVPDGIMAGRSYGADAQLAGAMAAAMAEGLKSQGIVSCLKHFPGIGSTSQDPHTGLSVTDRTEEQFRSEEFIAFKAGIDAGVQMVMIGHISAPGLTGDNEPCIFSERVVMDILREELGFDGVVITDALNMAAVSEYHTADEAAILALKAGCDMLLMPEDYETAYNGVLQAVRDGIISEERINDSLRRIYRIKYADKVQ